ncbi:alpha/beta fold hydrolase [Pedobacter frigiditerrae]|uniref:Alpha/beta fold hydrolase n=1 Tax=Pedobacter frigiditerrae TaxID=2530452 RepID=A0A4R0MIN7_9SPHI|nr:alpha/beta fold hydrolase [Pedobacter frigiditerrae]TCC86459.1 alpha/beta fold hydrolase [Pedobacter frigiditerrae]
MCYKYLFALLFFTYGVSQAQQKSISRNELYQYEGTYDFGNEHRITLGIFDELNQSLAYLDLKTLKIGLLNPTSPGNFRDINDSTKTFAFISKDNKIDGLAIVNDKTKAIAKKVAPHQVESISFQSGKNLIKGDLYLPATEGKHPVVVFAHGSGAATRGVGFFTTFFLQLGIGILTFDKQGAGASSGDWETASFDELANDIIAGVDFLKASKSIDPHKIGIMGNSQGGWTGSIAASKVKDLAFLVMRVGAGENVFNTISHEYKSSLLADGFTTSEINEIMAMYHANWDLAAKGKTWEDGNKQILSYRDKEWFKKVYPQERTKTLSSLKWWTWLSKNLSYDSYNYLQHIKTPTIWLMGEKDCNVNSQKSYPRIKSALQLAKNNDYTVAIIPKMAHNGMVAKNGYYNEPLSFEYAMGFWETLEQWLIDRKIGKK